ncbi:hypothetical protein B0T10DRAFT_149121 [Thelonectria olida]|uniref:Microbial-type PARG catalytic domain-containing protein n=1 Tax=Thelonectria olida TaxID=1576542 RepID=A0A9P8VVQ9_9HYPO|nr:hypothetical protein B0T10DRAFT_149121 [Thelonectria olida]
MTSSSNQGTLDQWLGRSTNYSQPAAAEPSSSEDQPTMPSHGWYSHHQPSSSDRNRDQDSYRRGAALAAIAKETRIVLPDILKHIPHIHASRSEAHYNHSTPRLEPKDCPKRTRSGRTRIKIVNDDSFNAAIELATSKGAGHGRVAVLNMANASVPGGGWLKGARAQEEALCYRSSLSLSLHRRYYPWQQRMGIYSPDVVIIRSDQDSGHQLLVPSVVPKDLPVVSVLSVAAIRCPPTDRVRIQTQNGLVEKHLYSKPSDRELTKSKMRLCLRMAAHHNHGLLVLGALGCGAFGNPPKEVANCWLEVLHEGEFQGGWWEEVWFAVFDKRNEGNLEVFEEVLGNVQI